MAGVHLLALFGDLDLRAKDVLDRELSKIDEFGRGSVTILDLRAVEYLDSVAVNSMFAVRRLLDRKGFDSGSVCMLTSPNSFVARMLDITGLGIIFPVFEEAEQARRYASAVAANLENRPAH